MTAQTTTDRETANHTILPSHAWMLGLVVADDGSLVPPRAANSPYIGTSVERRRGDERAVCTCPDFCDIDHAED